ncbi:MAG: amino acid ABC transporter ATP-binding protein [Liquorilactobacillus nagelii]|jgi:polar amino acid transport system ATP-binding protein|uniref:Glutamine ABC transporter ATP-binding protein n=1 Tax=Liquorilactobacillus nagelii TaxID=82688 RepID=A0A3Q8CG19_9LACO|nr:amino acid ABC transporter ATP-binding protein [Liquorilactobacillus nagelii]AUJ32807.1 glutamine ABC transporter ATP-binding protein [Liquorilactobacillus nagelii]MCC7616978.1 glutamine ABC transporter ATP-binding protein [Liquorilactobacillus nagelii]MCI1700686.1 amino acid ABC transporter ATP-binding protein [Liquorilactobacillus nagelii]MCP9315767.1 amino acid ABC transporter ATP-binding protein [Liquorilactobacillus nagelii]ULQ50213.1 amino acid ABC transporter ATP-binding protein [Liq
MTKEILRVEKLNKFYGKRQILFDVNFSIRQGEVLALLGPSGSGKSTLIRCLNGLEQFSGGSLFFAGQKVVTNEKSWQQLRQKIGMVFQSYDLFPNLTVLDNILLGPLKVQKKDRKQAEQEAIALLDRVGLAEYTKAYPRQLSGGQKQRIAIIRALALHPELMLFDEVTASLDPEMVRGVLEIIKELSEKDNMTMIIVTHEMNFAEQIADRVLFLDQGHVLEETAGKQFFASAQTERARDFLESMKF